MRILLTISLFIIFISSSKNKSSSSDNYYLFVNQGDRNLYYANFTEAKRHLYLAFEINNNPYYHDIYKMILCNSKIKNGQDNLKWLEKLVEDKNIHPKLIKFQLKGLLSESDIKYLDTTTYVERRSVVKSELLKLMEIDQKIRDYSKCDSVADPQLKRKCLQNLFTIRDSVDEINALKFINLINTYGIPSENEIGVYLKGTDKTESFNNLFYIFGIHFLQTSLKNKIYDIFCRGLQEGKFHPELFGAIYDFKQDNEEAFNFGKKMLNTTIVKTDGKLYKPFIHYTTANLDSINNNRIKIGLDSFHIVQRQILSDLICQKQGNIIPMHSFPQFVDYPYSFVKAAFEKENMDLKAYELKTEKISNECKCIEKIF